jgi:anhydro-N-acetylmuramic acid kinase
MSSLVVAGFMSGTSMDGLDCCIAKISISSSRNMDYKIIAQKSFCFQDDLKSIIKRNIGQTDRIHVEKISKYLGLKFLTLSKDFLSQYSFDYISLHGQTIHHIDKIKTIQAGDPSYMASFFKVPVIYNFRERDIDLGGNGAPLMPFLDWLIFKDSKKNILTLNLGGISNISFIPKNCNRNQVLGFDTGPGMCLIDQVVYKYWSDNYDKDGKYSIKGSIDSLMLDYLIKNTPFIDEPIPKSTGREQFGLNFINQIIKQFKNVKKIDMLRTLIKFTSVSIKLNIEKFILKKSEVDEIVVSGGGAFHPILMDDIKKDLDIPIVNIIDYGIESKFKESFFS